VRIEDLPVQVVLVGLVLDVALLLLGMLGAKRLWRRALRRDQPTTAPDVDVDVAPDEVLSHLRDEGRELDRLAGLRAEEAKMQRFLGFPAD
jgi:hypothetical protein